MEYECDLTGAGGAVGVVAGVRGSPVAPQAGIALAVRAGGVARCATELRRAAAGADGTLAREEPTSNCGSEQTQSGYTELLVLPVSCYGISHFYYSGRSF